MGDPTFEQRIADVRQFNRFYTQKIGVLHEGLLASEFSLAESRVIYELANRQKPTAGELARELELDPGYLSRILRRLEKQDLIARKKSPKDGRQALLALTPSGRKRFAVLNQRSHDELADMLAGMSEGQQRRLMAAMATITELWSHGDKPVESYLLRPHQVGDMGWVIHRHAVLYAREYGWDITFEAMVAEVAAEFINNFKPGRECCWVAEKDGEVVGSATVVEQSKTVAKLRLVYVEPHTRGLGIGRRLVEQCMDFARQAGYRRMTLWTNDILHAARAIYVKAGFELVKSEPHHSFGHDLVGEYWETKL
jgi:DNA-binding MarR family transcriptional regulator/GNAT superfamily N-acetyltransferase